MLALLTLLTCSIINPTPPASPAQEYYALIIWHYNEPAQEKTIHDFLSKSYLPVLHTNGFKKVGVFVPHPTAKDATSRIYMLIPMRRLADAGVLEKLLVAIESGPYANAAHNTPPFIRKEVTLMKAFSGLPRLEEPKMDAPRSQRVYELRSYEGPTEKLLQAKISMFNDGDEIGLFRKLGMNGIFCGEVIAGSRMPNLMYMTAYRNMPVRDSLWKEFFGHPQWKQLLTVERYKNSVSKADILLLQPTSYSDY